MQEKRSANTKRRVEKTIMATSHEGLQQQWVFEAPDEELKLTKKGEVGRDDVDVDDCLGRPAMD